MPRKLTTIRHRKAAAAKKEAEKEAKKNQPAKPAYESLESRVIIDENIAKHLQPTPLPDAATTTTTTSEDEYVGKKAAKDEAPESTNNAWELRNALDKTPSSSSLSDLLNIDETELVDQIWKDLEEFLISSDEDGAKDGRLSPAVDCSPSAGLVGDPGPVPPKFFGNTGYFMLTGTNSQLQQQLNDLAARNITVESHVLLPNAVADIVELQMMELSQNREKMLEKINNKYALLAQRRVPRPKKARKSQRNKKSED